MGGEYLGEIWGGKMLSRIHCKTNIYFQLVLNIYKQKRNPCTVSYSVTSEAHKVDRIKVDNGANMM